MTRRSVAAVIILTCLTAGIYVLIWFVKTKNEMVRQGADIPTAWLLIVPFASIYWMWKWAGGVEKVTDGKQDQAINFLLVFLTGLIGMAIIQSYLNNAIDACPRAQLPTARVV